MRDIKKNNVKPDKLLIAIFLVGLFVQLAPVWGFGLQYKEGVFLCCGNRQDYIFHVALTQSITNSFPPSEPGMAGVFVKNYHYWSNMVIAEIVRVFNLPAFQVQFQFVTILISILYGLVVIVFAQLLRISKVFTRWLLFFSFLGGDAIYLLLIILGKGVTDFQKVSSLEDGSSFLLNPPRAFSIVIAFAGLSLIYLWLKNRRVVVGLLSVVLLAATIGFKIYTGIFAGLGYLGLSLYFLAKRDLKNLLVSLSFFPIAYVVYKSNNVEAGGLFFAPFYLAKDFIIQPSFGLERLELARQIFLAHNNYIRVLQYEITFSIIFILAILGTKSLAFLQSIGSILRIGGGFLIFLLAGIIGSLFLGMFFLQTSGGANSFNFVVTFWIFMSVFAALALDFWQKKLKSVGVLIGVVVVLLTLPRVTLNTFSTIKEYLKFEYLMVSNEETEAFLFIKSNTPKDSLFLVDPEYRFEVNTPQVSAFVERPMFLSGQQILESHSIDTKERELVRRNILKSYSSYDVAKDLYLNNISYVLFKGEAFFNATESADFTRKIFGNDLINIYEVDNNKVRHIVEQQ
jgi:hypothetical protein